MSDVTVKLKDLRDAYKIAHAPMSRDQTDTFIRASLLDENIKTPFDEQDGAMLGGLGQVLWKRLSHPHSVEVSKGAAVVAITAADRIGAVVLWAYTLHEMWKKLGRMVTVQDIAMAFPTGFPTPDAVEKIWNAQKGYNNGETSGRNLIDDEAYWTL